MLGLVAVCAGVLVGIAAVVPTWTDDGADPQDHTAHAALEESLAMVELLDHPDSDPVTGLVVDDGHHVVVPAVALGHGGEVAVRIEGGRTSATLVATHDASGLALLRLAAPFGESPTLTDGTAVGDPLMLVHFGPDGDRHAHQFTADSTEAEMTTENPQEVVGMLGLEGPTRGQGPLADHDGRLAGWVMAPEAGASLAYPTGALMETVRQMLA